ncbi:unnamed protein product [Adineta ricciae]|uniref:Uncharacterized protein n=1 Tax=Adineta ricciae TaxID=249248 RepID=A0A816DQI9_ADIRI|nr:unnamed protein product [Adineta ricciae]
MLFFSISCFLLLIKTIVCNQLCYTVCTQFVPIGDVFQRPNCDIITNDSSVHCAVRITINSAFTQRLHLFYVTPVIERVYAQFIQTEIGDISFVDGSFTRAVYHDCPDCDIFLDRSKETVADMQVLPTQMTDVIASIRQFVFDEKEMNQTIECYGTTKKCLSCRIEIKENDEMIQSCQTENEWISIGVTLKEKSVKWESNINKNRTFESIDIQCTKPYCNTIKTVNSILAVLSQYNLTQQQYDIPSSASLSDSSIILTVGFLIQTFFYIVSYKNY